MSTDFKAEKRYRASRRKWVSIREGFANESCWVCGRPGWDDLHHIVPRSHSGDDVTANLVPLHRFCHSLIEARDPRARSLIRQALLPSNLAYLRYKLGENTEGWLGRNYPLGTYIRSALDLGLELGVELEAVNNNSRTTTNVGGCS